MDPGLLDTSRRVVFAPVRHHSPACARMVRRLALELRPAAILIEGPSDFNPRMHELVLPHQLPIAIYTYVRLADGTRRGAYYPFCIYSPEWQAVLAAQELGIPARFIDLPWAEMAAREVPTHRYADGELRYSDYIDALCRRLRVDDFDTLWDTLFEIERGAGTAKLFERCHRFCAQARQLDTHVPELDLRREAFMAARIREALDQHPGQILVVTGGFHSSALYELLGSYGSQSEGPNAPSPPTPEHLNTRTPEHLNTRTPEHLNTRTPEHPTPNTDSGIALTPYSYERLDSLTGYESGMPNPGFYHRVWVDRQSGKGDSYRKLLSQVVKELRKRGQSFSTADLIAVETTAQGLATVRGHDEVWRVDLLDGILGALVKDELELGVPHPFLDAVHEVFRGGARGQLAEGAELPPLVVHLRALLAEHLLQPEPRERTLDLELTVPEDLVRSRILHRIGALRIAGYAQVAGTDLLARDDLARVWERWRIRWSPEFEAACIEAAIYGANLEEAAEAALRERAEALERNADQAARILLDARLMGLEQLSPELCGRLAHLIRSDADFVNVTVAVGHLLFLYRYDETLGAAGSPVDGALLLEAWERALWLLEGLGGTGSGDQKLLQGIGLLLQTLDACSGTLELARDQLVSVLRRAGEDDAQVPLIRGAATGALWTLGEASSASVLAGIRYCAEPAHLGDYLTGLFALARETVQRHPDLVLSIDQLLAAYGEEQFLEALPSLRLAFSYFTPREKHYMAETLLRALGLQDATPLPALEVSPERAAAALALEARVVGALRRYGIRGEEA